MNMYLRNESGAVGYCALQISRGRIIVIDNELQDGMIVNRKYVMAHSPNVVLRRPFGNQNAMGMEFLHNLRLHPDQQGEQPLNGNQPENVMNPDNNPYYNVNAQQTSFNLIDLGMYDYQQI